MAKKKIILTRHAQERMVKRNVSREDIRKTVDHPTYTSSIKKDNTQELRRRVDNRENYIVVERKKNNLIIIITVGWSDE